MTDPVLLFQNNGLPAVIPHAFQKGGEHYRFVVKKLQEGFPLFLIRTDAFHTPYVEADHEGPYAIAFTDEPDAKSFCETLASSGIHTTPDRCEGQAHTRQLFAMLQDLGIGSVQINRAAQFLVDDIIAPSPYDGFLDLNHPLRNELMNATLLLLCQKLSIQAPCDSLFLFLFDRMQSGHLILPVVMNGQGEDPVTPDKILIPHLCSDRQDCRPVLLFTDASFFDRFLDRTPDAASVFPQRLFFLADYELLRSLILSQDNITFILNPGTFDLCIRRDAFLEAESALMLSRMTDPSPSACDEDDPVPDFLR